MEDDISPPLVEVFRGSRAACAEFGLVLDAIGLGYARTESSGQWLIFVPPASAEIAGEELRRYASERVYRREAAPPFQVFPGSGIGAGVYAFLLMLIAYCAGIQLFGLDWLDAGAIRSQTGAAGEWWRAVTALTLHLDQEHLLGNLLFGVGIGILAGRMFGPGLAWLSILMAGAAADYADMLVSPPWHHAVGASTAVFAALGLLAGFGWGQRRAQRRVQRLALREGRLYRWAPLFAGVCLLGLLGAGDQHVDVLGHLLGFLTGTAVGWVFARAGVPRSRDTALQLISGAVAILVVCTAWLLALRHAR